MEEQDNRFQPFVEYWMRAACPKCNKANWVYDSHSERMFPEAREAATCWNCKHDFWLGDKDDFEDVYGRMVETEEAFEQYVTCWEGKEKPT